LYIPQHYRCPALKALVQLHSRNYATYKLNADPPYYESWLKKRGVMK
jgi:hypothetical protein